MMTVTARIAWVLLFSTLLATTGAEAATTALSGKMSLYNYLLKGKWSCSAAGARYSAAYVVAGGNALHGHLYSAQSSEDVYFGYDRAKHRFWAASVDSTGAIESQTSADGVAYTGTLFDGKTTSKATNLYTMVSPRRWTVRARGAEGGQPYDLIATCNRV